MDNIHFNEATGLHSFVSVREKAWHNKGQLKEKYMNSAEALRDGGLDFTVEKWPLVTFPPERATNDGKTVPDYYATVRTDLGQALGIVGKDYHVVQNSDAFTFFDAIAGKDGVYYETAGALGHGERVFITAKLPGYISVGDKDMIDKYVFLTACHNGKGSIIAAFTPIRIVCNNTLNAALRDCSHVVKIRHTANALERLKEAHKVMGMVNTVSPLLEQVFNRWAKVKITDKELKQLICQAIAPGKEVLKKVVAGEWEEVSARFKNKCDKALEYALCSETQQMATTKGTLFGAYNAITGYYQNVASYKSKDSQLTSLFYGGSAQQHGQSAFDLCMDYAKHGPEILLMN